MSKFCFHVKMQAKKRMKAFFTPEEINSLLDSTAKSVSSGMEHIIYLVFEYFYPFNRHYSLLQKIFCQLLSYPHSAVLWNKPIQTL